MNNTDYRLDNDFDDFEKKVSTGFKKFFEDKKAEEEIAYPIFEEANIPEHITWCDLNKKVFPEQSWRIQSLIPKEGFVALASISGEKKTWVGMEMARCISSGINFLDQESFKTEGGNVLYLNAGENSENEIQRRGKQLGFSEESSNQLYIINSDKINLNQEEGAIWLQSFIEYYKIDVVFIDTFIAVAGGLKEDRSDEVRQFFNRFSNLKNKGVVLVWLMHLRKPNNVEGKGPKKEQLLGSQDKTGNLEVLLMIKSEAGSKEINCYQRKNRLANEIDPFQMILEDTLDRNGNKRSSLIYGGQIEEQENKTEEAKD